MNIYIYDGSGGQTKDWLVLCGPHFQPIIAVDGKFVSASKAHEQVNVTRCVVVLHGPADSEHSVIKAVIKALDANATACAVVVSASGLTVESPHERLYFRRTPVSKQDFLFGQCFKSFMKDLERSGGAIPNFSLLEPTAVPEPLLAYTLAIQYGLNIGDLSALRDAADVSYETLQAFAASAFKKKQPVSFPDVGVPVVTDFRTDADGVTGLRFKAMRNVIDLLREDV
jgi:hypothetical protein